MLGERGEILWVPLEMFTSAKTCVLKNSYHFLPRTGTHLYKQRDIVDRVRNVCAEPLRVPYAH